MSERMSSMNERIASLESTTVAQIADAKTDFARWMLAALTAQTAVLAALKLAV